MSDERKERTDMQSALLGGELYREVVATAEQLRSSHDYDCNRWSSEGITAVLCHAIERSCQIQTYPTLGGIYAALAVLKSGAKAGR